MIRYGYSGLPPDGVSDEEFLDGLVERGHDAFELAFVKDFPWKERRCAEFAAKADERGIWLSAHAPYFAVLTVQDETKAKQCRAAIEHTVKLGAELNARVIVAHLGAMRDETAEDLMPRIREHLEWIGSKIGHLGVGVGLETAGKTTQIGSLGDIALLANEFPFVRPCVDWAHVHAVSQGQLTSVDAFAAVIGFLRDQFPGWMLDPLHTQFSDVEYGEYGEIRHIGYGQGTLKVGPLVEAARDAGMRMTVISESRDAASHDAIYSEIAETLNDLSPVDVDGIPVSSGAVRFPVIPRAEKTVDGFALVNHDRPLRLSNLDKPFFPDGYTKGDLISYYASVAPLLIPHLQDRAIVMARFPDGAEGEYFYEKQAPGHQPDWMPLAPLASVGGKTETIDFVTARDAESLMWLANMGCIEIHPWLSRVQHIQHEDYAIFDLDPADGATYEQVVAVTQLLKVALDGLGLTGYPKTSGATGIHIYVPLDPVYPYARVRQFVDSVGRLMLAANPDDVTMDRHIPNRTGKVYIDVGQNRGGATIASVYSVRPRAGAPVSTPLRWNEVEDARPDDFTIETIWDRTDRIGDVFAPVLKGGQRLEAAEAELGIEPAE